MTNRVDVRPIRLAPPVTPDAIAQALAPFSDDVIRSIQELRIPTTPPFMARLTDGGTAGTAQADTILGLLRTPSVLRYAYVVPVVSVTADASNYASFFVHRVRFGVATQVAAGRTVPTELGSIGAYVPAALKLMSSSPTLEAGDVVMCSMTKTGSGVAVSSSTGAGAIFVGYEETGRM